MSTLFERPSPAMEAWLRDLRAREARGEVKVDWSRAREPDCVHPTSVTQPTQPASACRFCKDGAALRDWYAYWRSLGVPE